MEIRIFLLEWKSIFGFQNKEGVKSPPQTSTFPTIAPAVVSSFSGKISIHFHVEGGPSFSPTSLAHGSVHLGGLTLGLKPSLLWWPYWSAHFLTLFQQSPVHLRRKTRSVNFYLASSATSTSFSHHPRGVLCQLATPTTYEAKSQLQIASTQLKHWNTPQCLYPPIPW